MLPGPRSPLATELVLTNEEHQDLDRWRRSSTMAHGLVRRGQIVLLLAAGLPISEVARRVEVQRRIVRRWGDRFVADRLAGLQDRPRPGRPPGFPPSGHRPPRPTRLRAA